ncbi:MAG: type II toxin-antitoxin system HicB family antitoxin [Longimicrobiales bacterium]
MEHKGYAAAVSFDHDLELFTGWVVDLQDEIYFEGRTVDELVTSFHASVDDYLAFCEEKSRAPAKPYSGRILVRTTPEIHRAVAVAAAREGTSMNEWAERVFAKAARAR